MARWLPAELATWMALLAGPLDARLAGRLVILFAGMLFAKGRRTVASWLRAVDAGAAFPAYYYFLGSLGRKVDSMAGLLLRQALQVVGPGDRVLLGIDDTPTKRYGPRVQGAGIHHNPTPGPADQKFLYGHVWVTLALLVRHPLWACIGLPLRAVMYVRRKDIASVPRHARVTFRTKLEMAAELIDWVAKRLHFLGKSVWVVMDGAYGKRPVLRSAKINNIVVVSRLRKDARLYNAPKRVRVRRRGRPRKYGTPISLARRGVHARGWQTDTFTLYGAVVPKTYKTFVAMYPPADAAIRVVIVRETDGWLAFFVTDANATVTQILEAVADRGALEQNFHDVKEVHGAGQQQLRNYRANVAAFNLNLWLYTLIELWAWVRPHAELCDRSQSPWDDPERRPSHADRRNALRRSCLQLQFQNTMGPRSASQQIREFFTGLLRMVA
jgi:DDE superfamily endonuclease